MRKPLALLILAGLIALPAVAGTTVFSKPPNLGDGWFPLQACCLGSYVYADSFLAVEGERVPIRLGMWLREWNASPPPVAFEIWGDLSGLPNASDVRATTGSVSPAVTGTLEYFEYPVVGSAMPLTPGNRYWFVATVVGESAAGAYRVGNHAQNSVYSDNGVFLASNDPSGAPFDFGPTLPEIAYQIGLGPQILLYSDPCGVGSQFEVALEAMGYLPATTIATDATVFGSELAGGTAWDLVLVDSYDNVLDSPERAALIDYIAGGGRVAVSYWKLYYQADLVAALDAAGPGPTLTTPQPIYAWNVTHPLFNEPVPLASPIAPVSDTCDEDGAFFQPATGGSAIGGYTASPTANQAAIVIGNSGRSVLLGEVLNVFGVPALSVAADPESALGPGSGPGPSLASNTLHYLLDSYLFGNDFEVDRTCRWSNRVPTPVEVCNDLDDDCDGAIDDGNPGGGEVCNTGLPGACMAGLTLCDAGGVLVCDQQVEASAETCNDVDDNCDGATDEGNPGGGQACDTGIPGECAAGITSCQAGGVLACLQQVFATPEQCNALDDDCDGVIDDGDPGGGEICDTGLPGACGSGLTSCAGGSIECQQIVFEQPEINDCEDGIDNDCDGEVDCSDSDCVNEPACCVFFVEGLGCLRDAPPAATY